MISPGEKRGHITRDIEDASIFSIREKRSREKKLNLRILYP